MTSIIDYLIAPIAELWGLPTEAISSLVIIFLVLGISIALVRDKRDKQLGHVIFLFGLFIASLLGALNWIIVIMTLIIYFIARHYGGK